MSKIVVFGGTGFVGSFICKELAWHGHHVVSISKSGKNRYLSELETQNIRFVKADIFEETHWKEELEDAEAVVNSVGILFQNKKKDITYKKMIYESTFAIAEAAKQHGVKRFIQISAVKPPDFILKEYHLYKMRSENYLQNQDFKLLVIKPKIIVSKHKPIFYFFYYLQEIMPFFLNQFEHIENIPKQILNFLEHHKDNN